MSRNRIVAIFVWAVFGTFVAQESEAITIVYSDRDAFNAAAGVTTLLPFDPVVCQPHPLPFFCDVNYGLVSKRYELTVAPGAMAPPYIQISGENDANLPLSFTQPLTAVGFDVTPLQGGPIAFNLLLGAQSFVAPGGYFTMSSPSFLGFVSTEPLAGPLFIDPNHCTVTGIPSPRPCQFAIDNMALNVPVPEPSSIVLTTPLISIWLVRRRRRNTRPATLG